ncbi:cbb3-type cytochrome oxidase assembly protein CcoS [Pseudoroseicyclus aestuarii]|uniref:Cbb3-type cytochrome oxidase maturation protein n=1 Tax=Pseudoroseicyclus aestuarii TaxID=1795041 RepID=A0A318T041_9RHOB|nr:cbb3-type cytochrome oxidase assembly protein CcoS [Pseudoroseicyclus aestuarii]PYE82457.1 cbb3-type cytochrome oxidase maturation protein [Pseudoroseicyclus aestuarii]
MNVLAVLIPVSVGLGLVGLAGFVWTMRAAQYDDAEGDRHRVLDERWDEAPRPPGQSDTSPR